MKEPIAKYKIDAYFYMVDDYRDFCVGLAIARTGEYSQEWAITFMGQEAMSSLPPNAPWKPFKQEERKKDLRLIKKVTFWFSDIENKMTVEQALGYYPCEELGIGVVLGQWGRMMFELYNDEALSQMIQMEDEVSKKVMFRDRKKCCVPHCKGRILHRHSHLRGHTSAEVTDCFTLCHEHHRELTENKAIAIILEPLTETKRAKIRWVKK